MSDVIIAEHNIVEKAEYGHLGWEVVSGRIVPYSEDLGVSPYFSNRIREKVNHQKACNVIFCGQPGVSKTYSAIEFGRYIQPDFRVEQVAYTYGEYMTLQINEPEGHIIVLDEPEYVAGHRDWFLDINKALVATTRSGRFKVHPLFIPCINKSLLDKVIRKYLVQFMVWLEDRGEAIVYEISPSRFDESVWNIPICNLRIEMMDVEKCDKLWCLSCPSFEDNSCQLMRAKYEHRRKDIQMTRYKEDLEKTQKIEQGERSINELEELALKIREKFEINRKGNVDPTSLQVLMEQEYNIKLPDHRALILAKRVSIKMKRGVPNNI